MKKSNILIIGLAAAFLLSGCKSDSDSADNGEIKQQTAEVEQNSDINQNNGQVESTEQDGAAGQGQTSNTSVQGQSSGQGVTTSRKDTAGQDGTTHTVEELRSMVNNFVQKIDNLTTDKTNTKDREQFLSLKNEEEQIDNSLDIYEDEIENKYRNQSITKNEFDEIENEIEILEDMLDDAEDRLEDVFGIDD